MPHATPAPASADDHIAVTDALLRFGAGVDLGDEDLVASAFADDATVDFGPCGRTMGLDFPTLEGRDAVVGFLAATAETQVTTHVITNARVRVDAGAAALAALVDATHRPRDDRSRRLRMMNRYEAELVHADGLWRIRRMVIAGAWFEGDPDVLLGR